MWSARSARDPLIEADALMHLALVQLTIVHTRPPKPAASLRAALEHAGKTNSQRQIAQHAGVDLGADSKHTEAREHMSKALAIRERILGAHGPRGCVWPCTISAKSRLGGRVRCRDRKLPPFPSPSSARGARSQTRLDRKLHRRFGANAAPRRTSCGGRSRICLRRTNCNAKSTGRRPAVCLRGRFAGQSAARHGTRARSARYHRKPFRHLEKTQENQCPCARPCT